MKRVWKCDFCSHTHILDGEVKLHEIKCSFNPANKKCYSCKHHGDDGYYGDSCPVCYMKLDVFEGEDEGNCEGWETDDEKLLRKLKLQKLYEKG